MYVFWLNLSTKCTVKDVRIFGPWGEKSPTGLPSVPMLFMPHTLNEPLFPNIF